MFLVKPRGANVVQGFAVDFAFAFSFVPESVNNSLNSFIPHQKIYFVT